MKTNEPCPHPSIVVFEQGDKLTTQCTRCGKKMKVVKKPKCSCCGGFDCEVCNPDYYEEMKTTDTPRTDACPYCHSERVGAFWYACDTPVSGPQGVVCEERKARKKAEAEVAFWKSKAHEAEDQEGKLEAEVAELKENAQRIGINRYEQLKKTEAEVERLREELKKGTTVLSTIVTALEDAVPWIRETLNRD
jgi:ribosomal protein L37E